MLSKNVLRVSALALVVASLVGATTAAQAVPVSGSDGKAYVYDPNTGEKFANNKVFAFNEDTVIAQSATDFNATFACPVDSTSVQSFVSPIGSERTKSAWVSYSDIGNSKALLLPPVTLGSQTLGAPDSVRTAGGNYSVGIACLKDNSVNFASTGVYFFTAHVTAGTGAYTVDQPTEPAPPVDSTLTGSVDLSASTMTATNGVLSLSVPANATAAIGSPTLVGGLSTSTGTLGDISVNDGRVVTRQGWTLSASVTDFTNSADNTVTIGKAQLGFAPKIVSSTATGVVASAAQIAGSAVFPAAVATASAATAVGTTVVNADLKFVSPADKVAGTYTSKLTLTLASK